MGVHQCVDGTEFVVDDADDAFVQTRRWFALRSRRKRAVYVMAGQHRLGTRVYLHRHIMSAPGGLFVDHVDGDGLNNRRANLRLCTHVQNQLNKGLSRRNTTGFKGVTRGECSGRWRAVITVNGRQRHLGTFDSPEEASAAYIAAAGELHGEFAPRRKSAYLASEARHGG